MKSMWPSPRTRLLYAYASCLAMSLASMRLVRPSCGSAMVRGAASAVSRPSCPVPASVAARLTKSGSGRRAFSSSSGGGGGEETIGQRFWAWTTQKRPRCAHSTAVATVVAATPAPAATTAAAAAAAAASDPTPPGLTSPRTTSAASWREDMGEAAVIFTVFGITGSSSVALVRPALKHTIGLEGTMSEGPWSYRIGSILAVSPVYACVLLTVGTVAGRHTFFSMMATKIFGRFLPSSVSKYIACPPVLAKRTAQEASKATAKAGEKLTK